MLADFVTDNFCILLKNVIDDGMGDFRTFYTQDEPFKATVIRSNTNHARRAEQQMSTNTYTLVFWEDLTLCTGDLVKRITDGAVFEVVYPSSDMTTPSVASEYVAHHECEVKRVTMP